MIRTGSYKPDTGFVVDLRDIIDDMDFEIVGLFEPCKPNKVHAFRKHIIAAFLYR